MTARLFGCRPEGPGRLDQLDRSTVKIICRSHAEHARRGAHAPPWGSMSKRARSAPHPRDQPRSLAVALPQVASNAMDDREVTSTPMDLLHPNGSGPLWGMASRDLNATSW